MKQYQRIQQYILDGIARGRWVAGQRLPSENELAKLHTTSRMTVRRAL
ncbi:MAG: GntR family transcriptional regulator, partial [Chloroflexi bacterium]